MPPSPLHELLLPHIKRLDIPMGILALTASPLVIMAPARFGRQHSPLSPSSTNTKIKLKSFLLPRHGWLLPLTFHDRLSFGGLSPAGDGAKSFQSTAVPLYGLKFSNGTGLITVNKLFYHGPELPLLSPVEFLYMRVRMVPWAWRTPPCWLLMAPSH